MNDILLEKVTKDYGNKRGIFDVNIEIQKGEIFGFVGTNGSGKTTTIRHIMGFIKADQGRIYVRNLDAYKEATKTKQFIGYVPGEIAFPDLKTGISFIRSQGEFLNMHDYSYADKLIKAMQLDLNTNPRKMSKGMKQKTAIVAALMDNHDILLLDEPTTGLDPLMRKSFLDILREEKKKGKTILISSHIFEELEDLCDRVALIKDGYIVDVVNIDSIKNPKARNFKIEFVDEKNYNNFPKSSFTIIKDKKEQNQLVLKIKREELNAFFTALALCKLKFLAEEKYNLEKYFREKLNIGVEANK